MIFRLPRGFRPVELVDSPTLPRPTGDPHSELRWGVASRARSAGVDCCRTLDVLNKVFATLCFGRVNGPIDALVFAYREERFSHAVIPTHAGATHTMDDRIPRWVTLARNSADLLLSPIESAWSLICRSAHRV